MDATNATLTTFNVAFNATASSRDYFDVYSLLAEHCDAPPDDILKNAYGGLAPLLFVALLTVTTLDLGEAVGILAADLKAGVNTAADMVKSRIRRKPTEKNTQISDGEQVQREPAEAPVSAAAGDVELGRSAPAEAPAPAPLWPSFSATFAAFYHSEVSAADSWERPPQP